MSGHPEQRPWSARAAQLLAARSWGHRTSAVRALHWSFVVHLDDTLLGRHLDRVLAGLPRADPGELIHEYSLLVDDHQGLPRHRLYVDSERLLDTPVASLAFRHLLWHVNQAVIRTAAPLVAVHAGVVATRGRAMLLPAVMESGKTTLTAGLVHRGFDYLSDEAAAIDPRTGLVQPFARALSVDPGSQEVLADLTPDLPPGLSSWTEEQWQVPPEEIRRGSVGSTCPVGWIVFPGYVQGAATRLEPLGRADALVALVANCMNLRESSPAGYLALAELARAVPAWRLVVGDLAEACALLAELAGATDVGRRPADGLWETELDGETVLYDHGSGAVHRLNPTATAIWRELRTGDDVASVARRLSARHGIGGAEMLNQVDQVVEELGGLTLFSPSDGARHAAEKEYHSP